jgi:hypothetical protein
MKKSLADSGERVSIMARLRRLAPDSRRQWGKMTSHQAICHLSDSFPLDDGSRTHHLGQHLL